MLPPRAAFSPRSCAAVGLVDAPAPRRVFDAFMLSAENLMLRLRLEELATVVDKFLLARDRGRRRCRCRRGAGAGLPAG